MPKTASASVLLDPSYGSGGTVTTSFGSNTFSNQVAVQADDKAVVVGRVFTATGSAWKIVRYNTNGSLDTSFGNNG